ncbi:MAG: DNA recombination protein RmuC, partial [Fimbriimonadaceae bacterium]|nr:DNA recombination protein RmuC [Chitinophagales bacterium]
MEPLIYILIGLIIGGIVAWIIRKLFFEKNFISRDTYDGLKKSHDTLQGSQQGQLENNKNNELRTSNLENDLNEKISEIILLSKNVAQLEEQTSSLEKNNSEFKREIEEIGKKFGDQFKVLANEILEDKSKKFTEENQKNIKQILEPLDADIKNFKQKIDTYYLNESNQRFSLQTEIKKLFDLNQQLSGDAKNLTKALTGDTKIMGNWGEQILERILEKVGLLKGREYITQEGYRDTEGILFKPDVIVNLPDNRSIIIDSKVSITAYEKFISTDDVEEQKRYLKEHLNSVYSHIDGLSKKNYSDLLGDKSLDMVLMFVHIEPAYYAAQQSDPELWQYAYSKGIVLVSPSTLLSAMKLIADLW